MSDVISNTRQIARKDYPCDACYTLRDAGVDKGMLTFAERRVVVAARQNGWMIKKGQEYSRYVYNDGGIMTYRSIPAISKICQRLELYED